MPGAAGRAATREVDPNLLAMARLAESLTGSPICLDPANPLLCCGAALLLTAAAAPAPIPWTPCAANSGLKVDEEPFPRRQLREALPERPARLFQAHAAPNSASSTVLGKRSMTVR